MKQSLGALILLPVVGCLLHAQAGAPAQSASKPEVRMTDWEGTQGHFEIHGSSFTVVVHGKKLVRSALAKNTPVLDQGTAESFSVRDSAGKELYKRSVLVEQDEIDPDKVIREGGFEWTNFVSANLVRGSSGEGIVVTWGYEPSAPDSCSTYQFFGLLDRKLVPFGEPFCDEIEFAHSSEVQNGAFELLQEPGIRGDVFTSLLFTGYYRVLIPVRIDFDRGQIEAAEHCYRPAPQGNQDLCDFPVRVDDRAPVQRDTFVRLYPEPDARMTPQHVVVHPNSQVQFLAARTRLNWSREPNRDEISRQELPWLKVRIDGIEGWLEAPEDLEALGLQQSGWRCSDEVARAYRRTPTVNLFQPACY